MMMVILIVDGELMDVIEMMVDKQADLVVNLEADKVTKEKRKVDQEQDEGSETHTHNFFRGSAPPTLA